MNEIFERRSIRRYTEQPVEEQKLRKLVEAGFYAPTGKLLEPWQFLIIDDREILKGIAANVRYVKMLENAPNAIVVLGDTAKSPDMWRDDCAAATENILLEAKYLGLGSCWCGIYPAEEKVAYYRKALKIPEPICPYSLIALGYPAEQKEAPLRYDGTKVYRNSYGAKF